MMKKLNTLFVICTISLLAACTPAEQESRVQQTSAETSAANHAPSQSGIQHASTVISNPQTAAGTLAGDDDQHPVPDSEFVYCTVCHGIQMMGNRSIHAPRLSGMDTWYIERTLHKFKDELRGKHAEDLIGLEMQQMAVPLSDEQITQAAIFVKGATSAAPAITVEGDAERGQALYATCAACHGPNGQGVEALGGPNLTIANDWYLVSQLEKFRDGSRGSAAGDTWGMQMRASVQVLPDEQAIRDVVAYIQTLRNQ